MKVLKKKRRKTGKKSIAQPEPIRTNISIWSYKNFLFKRFTHTYTHRHTQKWRMKETKAKTCAVQTFWKSLQPFVLTAVPREKDPLPAPQRGERKECIYSFFKKKEKEKQPLLDGYRAIPANRPSTWNGNKNTPTYRRLVGRRHPFRAVSLSLPLSLPLYPFPISNCNTRRKRRRKHFLPIAFKIGEHFEFKWFHSADSHGTLKKPPPPAELRLRAAPFFFSSSLFNF